MPGSSKYTPEKDMPDDWDPRAEDFNNPQFNSYTDGPGRNLRPSAHHGYHRSAEGEQQVTKLYVKSIPSALSEEAVRSIFAKYGEILELYVSHSKPPYETLFAFVTFKSARQAATAMYEVNKENIMKVSFALTDDERNKRKTEQQKEDHVVNNIVNATARASEQVNRNSSLRSFGRGAAMDSHNTSNSRPGNAPQNRFRDSGYASNTSGNQLTHRSSASSTRIGRGGGHNNRVIPDLKGNSLSHGVENENQVFKFGQSPLCSLCQKQSLYMCSCEKSYYCSMACQTQDWESHRLQCKNAPPLVPLRPAVDSDSDGKCSTQSGRVNGSRNGQQANRNGRFSGKRKEPGAGRPVNWRRMSQNGESSEGFVPPNSSTPVRNGNVSTNISHLAEDEQDSMISQNANRYNSAGRPETSKPMIPSYELPENEYSEVEIVVAESQDDMFVQPAFGGYRHMFVDLQMHCSSCEDSVKLVIGGLCAAKYSDDLWYRTEIIGVSPVEVLFIDFGNKAMVDVKDLRPLLPKFLKLPSQAVKIKIHPSSPLAVVKESVNLEVKPVRKENNVTVVIARKVGSTDDVDVRSIQPVRQTTVAAARGPSSTAITTDLLRTAGQKLAGNLSFIPSTFPLNGDERTLQISAIISSMSFWALIVTKENEQHFMDVQQITPETVEKVSNYRPSVGTIVAAPYENSYYRAVILSIRDSTYSLFFIDYGNEAKVTEVFPLTEALKEIPAFALFCEVQKGVKVKEDELEKFIKPEECFQVQPLNTDSHEYQRMGLKRDNLKICVLHVYPHSKYFDLREQKIAAQTGNTTSPKPPLSSNGVSARQPIVQEDSNHKTVKIDDKMPVLILAHENFTDVYVRPAEETFLMEFLEMEQKMLHHASSAPKLEILPKVGTLVGCYYKEDSCYYRAKVLAAPNVDVIDVHYVDYGNKEVVKLHDLCPLSLELLRFPIFAANMTLDSVPPCRRKKQKAEDLLKSAIEGSKIFTLKYAAENKVVLKSDKDSESLNAQLHKILTTEEGDAVVMLDELSAIEIPVGKQVKLAMSANLGASGIMCCPSDISIVQRLEDLQCQINEYCSNASLKPYNARPEEVCLAIFEEDKKWYRASVVEDCVDTVMVYYVDFGNIGTVRKSDIRKIPEEFLVQPAVVSQCALEACQNCPSLSNKHFAEIFPAPAEMEAFVLRKEDDTYYIRVPEVEKILINLGILTAPEGELKGAAAVSPGKATAVSPGKATAVSPDKAAALEKLEKLKRDHEESTRKVMMEMERQKKALEEIEKLKQALQQ